MGACDGVAPAATPTVPVTAAVPAEPTATLADTPIATLASPIATVEGTPRSTTMPPTVVEDCGAEVRKQGATTLDDRARDCLLRAFQAGTAATFTSTRPTIEGDPIVTRIDVVGTSDIRVIVDMTKDKFSAPADRVVRTYRCTTLTRTQVNGLRPLSVTGCTDGAAFEV